MPTFKTEIMIDAPIDKVFEFCTNPDNIKESWPRDLVKESENVSGQKSEVGSEMKVEGHYMGKSEEMTIEVTQKEQNKRLVTRQIDGPFESWESIQEFQNNGNTSTMVSHTINYKLPTASKIGNFLTGKKAEDKIRQGLEQAAQTVKSKLETQ
ncbi:MAG TPA: SRPBCC family protein [Candidatus Saccharimonadales bacterium]|nr:SRPBCC family protein [Candidatus Saccharimonadales bacterium]